MYPDTGDLRTHTFAEIWNGRRYRCGAACTAASAATTVNRASVVADRIDAHVPAHGLNAGLISWRRNRDVAHARARRV